MGRAGHGRYRQDDEVCSVAVRLDDLFPCSLNICLLFCAHQQLNDSNPHPCHQAAHGHDPVLVTTIDIARRLSNASGQEKTRLSTRRTTMMSKHYAHPSICSHIHTYTHIHTPTYTPTYAPIHTHTCYTIENKKTRYL